MMQSLMGAAIFRRQSLPNDNRKARRGQRFQISVLSFPLNSAPLMIVSFCSNAHTSCAQKFPTICMPSTDSYSKRQLAYAQRVAPRCQSDPATWLLLFLSRETSRFPQFFSALDTFISYQVASLLIFIFPFLCFPGGETSVLPSIVRLPSLYRNAGDWYGTHSI